MGSCCSLWERKEMLLKDFILKTSDMVDSENKTPVLDWIEFACDMADSCGSRMEQELDDIFRSLCYVKNNFCPETFQASLRMLCLPNEIIYGAMFSDAGVAPETIRELANAGVLECGYIPEDTWEMASLSLIQMEEPKMLWVVENEEPLQIERLLQRIASQNRWEQVSVSELLNHQNLRIQRVGNEDLSQALLNAFTSSSAIDRIYVYQPQEHRFSQSICPALREEQDMEEDLDDENLKSGIGFIPEM